MAPPRVGATPLAQLQPAVSGHSAAVAAASGAPLSASDAVRAGLKHVAVGLALAYGARFGWLLSALVPFLPAWLAALGLLAAGAACLARAAGVATEWRQAQAAAAAIAGLKPEQRKLLGLPPATAAPAAAAPRKTPLQVAAAAAAPPTPITPPSRAVGGPRPAGLEGPASGNGGGGGGGGATPSSAVRPSTGGVSARRVGAQNRTPHIASPPSHRPPPPSFPPPLPNSAAAAACRHGAR